MYTLILNWKKIIILKHKINVFTTVKLRNGIKQKHSTLLKYIRWIPGKSRHCGSGNRFTYIQQCHFSEFHFCSMIVTVIQWYSCERKSVIGLAANPPTIINPPAICMKQCVNSITWKRDLLAFSTRVPFILIRKVNIILLGEEICIQFLFHEGLLNMTKCAINMKHHT